jgi:membrane protein DedA with SNARE-associated domain
MSFGDLSELALGWLLVYGPAMLGILLLVAAFGVPLPGTLLVIAAGAFARQGYLAIPSALAVGWLGVMLGDMLSYSVGRFASTWITGKVGATATWRSAAQGFARRGFWAVYLTRWLVTPLALPTNLIAGLQTYPVMRFLAAVALGEATWLILYGGLGYSFGVQWEALGEFAGDLSGLLAGLAILGLGIALAFRLRGRVRSASPSLIDQHSDDAQAEIPT